MVLEVDNVVYTLRADVWYPMRMALRGYRRSPRLWQDWFAEVAVTSRLRRLKVDPAGFAGDNNLVLLCHVDDLGHGRTADRGCRASVQDRMGTNIQGSLERMLGAVIFAQTCA